MCTKARLSSSIKSCILCAWYGCSLSFRSTRQTVRWSTITALETSRVLIFRRSLTLCRMLSTTCPVLYHTCRRRRTTLHTNTDEVTRTFFGLARIFLGNASCTLLWLLGYSINQTIHKIHARFFLILYVVMPADYSR